jgi:hypothetical protein
MLRGGTGMNMALGWRDWPGLYGRLAARLMEADESYSGSSEHDAEGPEAGTTIDAPQAD